jgi:formate hydrogenlyase subunit 3/multisubunit Na+/H+ antiporter MnhD subunit
VTRWLLGLAGLPVAGYGGWLLLSRADHDQLFEVALWLVSGVVAHDLLIACLAALGGLLVVLLPKVSRAPAAVALILVGSLSLVALPVLGGFGEDAGNSTHLDRPYVTAWLALTTVAVVAVLVATVVRVRNKGD